jgi:hypothetical protein
MLIPEEKVRCRSIRKYPCKKLKGEHDFWLIEESNLDSMFGDQKNIF